MMEVAYMFADTTAKVGFRPYHQTDPFGAAHLSGVEESAALGEYHLNRPFDPWELYADVHDTAGFHGLGDLGQGTNPFKPGAWHLHGLGDLGDGTDVTAAAADELLSSGAISAAQHAAILDGSANFQDVLGYDPTDQGSWLNAIDVLRNWNHELQSLESQAAQAVQDNLHSGAQPSAAFHQLTADLNAQRQHFNEVSTSFVNVYRAVMGSVPAGLSGYEGGLGIAPVVAWIVGAAAALAAVYFGYQAFQAWRANIDVAKIAAQTAQTQAKTQQDTCAFLQAQLAAAQARGDTVTANTIIAQLKSCGAGPGGVDLSSWVTTNAKWLGLGAAGLIVLGPLSSSLFGGKRR